jgi:hypothetical protein
MRTETNIAPAQCQFRRATFDQVTPKDFATNVTNNTNRNAEFAGNTKWGDSGRARAVVPSRFTAAPFVSFVATFCLQCLNHKHVTAFLDRLRFLCYTSASQFCAVFGQKPALLRSIL